MLKEMNVKKGNRKGCNFNKREISELLYINMQYTDLCREKFHFLN